MVLMKRISRLKGDRKPLDMSHATKSIRFT